jgi:uridine kinase
MAFIIGIAGGSGGGKTTFIKELRARFSETEVCVISQDEYYKPIDEQEKDEEGIENFDLPRSIDKKAFRDDILKLKAGETLVKKEYMFNNSAREPKILTFLPAPIIVVEGLFVFHFKKINALLDLKIFVDAKDVFKVARRIRRDAVERGYDINDVIYRFENHVTPSWERFIEPYRDEADIVVNNNLREMSAGFEVICGFISQKLIEIR